MQTDIYKQKIIDLLRADGSFSFKENSQYFSDGRCPACGKKELFVSKNQPYRLACNRLNKCGFSAKIYEIYPQLRDLNKHYPASPANPEATAEAYLTLHRGFNDLSKIKQWFSQGSYEGQATVKFKIPETECYWERIIENNTDRRQHISGKKNEAGELYKGYAWYPPTQTIEQGDEVYVVEGIFHALALYFWGKKVIACISGTNVPQKFIQQHANKNITWVLAMDNDDAGIMGIRKLDDILTSLNQTTDYALAPKEKDWDDLFAAAKTSTILKSCQLRGRIEFAKDVKERAYYIFKKYGFIKSVVHFNNSLYKVWLGKDALQAVVTAGAVMEKITFKEQVDIAELANFYPIHIYNEEDVVSGEVNISFKIKFANGSPDKLVTVYATAIKDAKAFNQALVEKTGQTVFNGSNNDLKHMVSSWWFKKSPKSIKSYQYAGFIELDKNKSAYVFPEFAYYQQRFIQVNADGYLDLGQNSQVKCTLKGVKISIAEPEDVDMIKPILSVYGHNGLFTLGFWAMGLFAQQIRAEHQSVPFLELVGEPNSGKTTLLQLMWNMFGIKGAAEGSNPGNNSSIANQRLMQRFSNLPLIFKECDYLDRFNWDEYKSLYEGGYSRIIARKTGGNEVSTPEFRGTLIMTQNNLIEASIPFLERLVSLNFKKFQDDVNHFAPIFKIINKNTGWLLDTILMQEKQLLNAFFEHFNDLLNNFQARYMLTNGRIIRNYSQLAAGVLMLEPIIKTGINKKQIIDQTEMLILKSQLRAASEHPLVDQFWDIYDNLSDTNGQSKAHVLNHSYDEKYIAINLSHLNQVLRESKYDTFNVLELKRYLNFSKRRKFVEIKNTHSKILKKTIKCWIFLADKEDQGPSNMPSSAYKIV